MRSLSVLPDLSSASLRVSDTVSTANFSATNCLLVSMPGIKRHFLSSLQLCRTERIARRHLSLLQPGLEPPLPLRGRAVRERIRHDIALRLLLQTVIADRGRRLQRRLHVARLDRFPALVGMKGPDAGIAIGLQFDANLNAVCSRL